MWRRMPGPDSISAMVYELPRGWQWLWIVWMWVVSLSHLSQKEKIVEVEKEQSISEKIKTFFANLPSHYRNILSNEIYYPNRNQFVLDNQFLFEIPNQLYQILQL